MSAPVVVVPRLSAPDMGRFSDLRSVVGDEFTVGVDAFDELDTGPVGQVTAARCVEDGQVGASSGPEVTDVGSLQGDRKSTRLNSSHVSISYAVFCLK